ncbi:hypothetical protein EXIGLDRAFT_750616 [Exidia glandulosa HHB12029]|uniref:Uncharacterized protein n=1 Tax=Exidia glandulosa HHB12029 TaxID=1314781 RepID=A0A165GHG7_EXIGL|nr:hypothetical protein EXIGLDRAFT_750616 [Exidia glandulosa HHB12029]
MLGYKRQPTRYLVKSGEWENWVGQRSKEPSVVEDGKVGYYLMFQDEVRPIFFPLSMIERTTCAMTVPAFETTEGNKLGGKPAGNPPRQLQKPSEKSSKNRKA